MLMRGIPSSSGNSWGSLMVRLVPLRPHWSQLVGRGEPSLGVLPEFGKGCGAQGARAGSCGSTEKSSTSAPAPDSGFARGFVQRTGGNELGAISSVIPQPRRGQKHLIGN